MKEQILLINDMAGYGKVALSAMIPILSNMGYHLYNLPTALVSNTLDYGKFDILDTTEYMKKTLAVWQELGFSFDCICTGFIVSEEQVQLISDYCRKLREDKKSVHVFVDPIMGDDGALYHGITDKTVCYMRELCSLADVIVPNFTEASFLAEKFCGKNTISRQESEELIHDLRSLGAKSVVITSACVDGQTMVCGYDKKQDQSFFLPFSYIPVRFPGTGDLFSAVLTGKFLSGNSLQNSVQAAMDVVSELLIKNQFNEDKYKGIPIEAYLKDLNL